MTSHDADPEAGNWTEPYRRFYKIAGFVIVGFLVAVGLFALLGAVSPGVIPIATWSFIVGASLLGMYVAMPVVLWVLGAMTRRLNHNDRAIDQLQEDVKQADHRVHSALDNLEKGLQKEHQALQAARRQMRDTMRESALASDQKASAKMAAAEGRMHKALDKTVADLAGRIDDNRAATKTVRDTVKEQLRALQRAVADQAALLRKSKEAMDKARSANDGQYDGLMDRVKALEAQRRQADAVTQAARERLEDTWRAVAQHEARLNAHDERLAQVESDVIAAHAQARNAYHKAEDAMQEVLDHAASVHAGNKALEKEFAKTGRKAAQDLAHMRETIQKEVDAARDEAASTRTALGREHRTRAAQVAHLEEGLDKVSNRLADVGKQGQDLSGALNRVQSEVARVDQRHSAAEKLQETGQREALKHAQQLGDAIADLSKQQDVLAKEMAQIPKEQKNANRRQQRKLDEAMRKSQQELDKLSHHLEAQRKADIKPLREEIQRAREALSQAQDALEQRLSADIHEVGEKSQQRDNVLREAMANALDEIRGVQAAAAKDLQKNLRAQEDKARAREKALKSSIEEAQSAMEAANAADRKRLESAVDAVRSEQRNQDRRLTRKIAADHAAAEAALNQAVGDIAHATGDTLKEVIDGLSQAWNASARRASTRPAPKTKVARAAQSPQEQALHAVREKAHAAIARPGEANRARFDDALGRMQELSRHAVDSAVRRAHKDQNARTKAWQDALRKRADAAHQDLMDAVDELAKSMHKDDAKLAKKLQQVAAQAHKDVEAAMSKVHGRLKKAEDHDRALRSAQDQIRDSLNGFIESMQNAPATEQQRHEMAEIATAYIEKRLRDLVQRQEAALLAYTDGLEGEYDAFLASPPEVRDEGRRAIPVKSDRIYEASPFGRVAPIREIVMNAKFRTRLRDADVHDTQQLWELPATRVARAAGVPIGMARAWQAACGLNAIEGIGPAAAQLLAAIGIESVEDLSQQDVQELQERADRFQKKHQTIFTRPVGSGQASRWVELAQAHRPAHRAKALARR